MEERRKRKRIRMVSQLEVVTPSASVPINAFTVNLSREGIGFCCGKKIEEGSEIKIRVIFDHLSKEKVQETVTGQVRWVKQISRIYEAGVLFSQGLNRSQHANLLKQVGEL
ncbi:MAG: PilZ domain-containing protein [Nitrospirae bacterium]|nr:PilZ domain-containing protein [Nitrospirota bacterium]